MKRSPIVTNADRDWAIKKCPKWMRPAPSDDRLPEIVDDGGWLDGEDCGGAKPEAPSAFDFVSERIEEFERFFSGQMKTEAEWSFIWRNSWFPKIKPEQRYPKSAPKVVHPYWRMGTPEFDRAMQVATDLERRMWPKAGFAQVRASDDRLAFIEGGV